MSLESLLSNDSASLQTPTTVADSSGGKSKTYATTVENVPVRIQDAKTSVKADYRSHQIEVTNTVITQEASGQHNDRWLGSDGVTCYIIKGIRVRRQMGSSGIETFYLYDTAEAKI